VIELGNYIERGKGYYLGTRVHHLSGVVVRYQNYKGVKVPLTIVPLHTPNNALKFRLFVWPYKLVHMEYSFYSWLFSGITRKVLTQIKRGDYNTEQYQQVIDQMLSKYNEYAPTLSSYISSLLNCIEYGANRYSPSDIKALLEEKGVKGVELVETQE